MKNTLIILIILTVAAGLLIVSPVSAQIVDAPHNASNSMGCTDCHADPYSLVYTDDVCLSCHNNSSGGGYSLRSAPKVLTHSSENTSAKYGTWSAQCLDCHSKHTYEQRAAYQSRIFLVQGTVTSITDNGDGTTTFGYSNLTESVYMPGWSDYMLWSTKSFGNIFSGNERGLIFYPNISTYQKQSAASLEVASATATTVTVKGSINTAFPTAVSNGTIAVGTTFGLAYGQFINTSIFVTPTILKPAGFFQNTGYYSFAYSTAVPPSTTDPQVNSVCQACHTRTLHWRNDGTLADHYANQNCTTCHKHEEGFKISCDACHPAPPTTGAHVTHSDAGFAEYGTTSIQSTPAAYGFSCGICHSGTHLNTTANPRTAEVNFAGIARQNGANAIYTAAAYSVDDPGSGYLFNYSDGTCSSVYCHGNYPGSGNNALVTFTAGSASCGSCHNASNTTPPASGSHVTHASTGRYNLSCTLCHSGEVSGAGPSSYAISDKQKHVSGTVDWAFDAGDTRFSAASSYSVTAGTAAPSNGTSRSYGSCSTTYCHSDGTAVATLAIQPNTSPVWGSGALSCTGCHSTPPAYTSGSPKANSHAAHSASTCNQCHVTTTTDGMTITSAINHANKAYDVNPDTASGVTFTYSFAPSGGYCSNISCHGGGTATWGAALTCQNCHLTAADLDDFSGFFYNNNTTSKIKGPGEWDSTGHGRPAASGPYASGNSAADFTTANACQYCHDSAVVHKTAANPFRLRAITDATWGMNGVCQNCHAEGSAGITVDSVLKNGAKKVGSLHYGSKHNAGANGGQFCWDCHDPHGDGNIFMIHAAVAKTSDMLTGAPQSTITTSFVSYTTGTSYAKSTAPFNGVCNVCHTSTNHYTATSGDDHNAATRCTSCHAHTRDTATNAFGASCDGCHGNPPIDNTSLAGRVYPSSTGSVTAGNHESHVSTLHISCDSCHANSVGSGTTHNNGDMKVTLGFSLFDGAYVGGAYNGQTTVQYNASSPSTTVSSGGLKECSNIYCHGSTMAPNGGTDTSPVWDNSATAACGTCHGATAANPPTRGAHFRHAGPITDVGHSYACSLCHRDPSADASLHVNNKSEVMFSNDPTVAGASYSGTTAVLDAYGNCSNVYCHSNVQTSPPGGALTYKNPNWSDRFASDPACNACHEGPADHYSVPLTGNTTGSHTKHAAYTIYCSTCHANNINDDPSPDSAGWGCTICHTATGPNDKHGDHSIDVKIVSIYGGAYSGTPAPGDAYGSCSTTYCHSNGASVRTGSVSANVSATWGSGALACNACHGNNTYFSPNNAMPAYVSGSPKENSHVEHVINHSMACASCHAGTTTTGTTIANLSLHVNKKYDMQSSGTFAGKAISFTYSAATTTLAGSCSSISCHGGNTAAWGSKLACSSCHSGAADVDDYAYGNGTFALVSTAQWTTTGHGRSAASGPYASGNAAAEFTVGNACQYCHDNTIAHNDTSNPFRLRGITNPTWGWNSVCQNCHAEGSAGITIDSVLRNGSKKVGSVHYGAKHSALANGGQFCWDCHDAHGDSNAYMIHGSVAKTSNPATGVPTSQIATVFNLSTPVTGSDFAKSTAPFDGVCNVCHTSTSHYTSTSGDGHNAGINCNQCHNHTDGFKPSGDSCSDCHSAAGGSTPGTAPDAYHAKHVQTAYTGRISSGDYGNYATNQWYRYSNIGGRPDTGCGYCHPQSAATHMNGVVNLNFDPNDAGAAGTLKAKNNTTQQYTQNTKVSVTCSSVYCHSNGYLNGTLYGYVTTPEWYGGSFSGDKCASCHGNSPTGSAAHAAHAVGIHYNNIFTGTTGTASAGNTDTSSHGYVDINGTELTSTTINCNICHNSTVTMAANDSNALCAACHTGSNLKGIMAIAAGSTTHVNGQVDVVFTSTAIRSKAQVRDSIASVAELNDNWTRMNGYKGAGSYDAAKTTPSYSAGNCTVACHNSKPVSWSSTVTCNSCHADLP